MGLSLRGKPKEGKTGFAYLNERAKREVETESNSEKKAVSEPGGV